MSIAAGCKCGKQFKVKNHLAGKTVRCPACKKPLRIPGRPRKAGTKTGAVLSKSEEKKALLKFDQVQRQKQQSEEERAAFRQEQKKVIQSYDQLAGKSGKKEPQKRELAGMRKRKVTIFTKLSDAWGAIKANLFCKYMVITALFCAGALGSVYLVRFVATYATEETIADARPVVVRIKDLMKEAEEAIEAKNWSAATSALRRVVELDPNKERNREYIRLQEKLEREIAKH
ncbi:MAG: hypothetical protein ABII12_02455 [Planctomycetota bacterium]